MKKYLSIILFVSFIFVAFSISNKETLNTQIKVNQTETFEINQDLQIQEKENQPLLKLGFLTGLAPIIGGLIGGGGGMPQPPVQAPVSAPPSGGGGGGGGGSSSSDSSPMPMIIILVVMVLAFIGLRK